MDFTFYLTFVFLSISHPSPGLGTCPAHCVVGQTCNATDSGCPVCDRAYYGRQCQHRTECRYNVSGEDYRGTIAMTLNGLKCQYWGSQTPHSHSYGKLDENYCINVASSGKTAPWCYTSDPKTRWAYCNPPMCDTQCARPVLDAPFVDIANPPPNGFSIGYTATFGCVSGYEHDGIFTSRCQADRTWSKTCLPICKKIKCPLPKLNKHSKIDNQQTTYKFKDNITIRCDQGYSLQGNKTLICQADRNWNTRSPSCISNKCKPPQLQLKTRIKNSKTTYQYQEVITIVCNTGYDIQGTSQLTCQHTGTWDKEPPTCTISECQKPSLPYTVYISNKNITKFVFGTVISFSCVEGHKLKNVYTSVCQANGKWSKPVPLCEMIYPIKKKFYYEDKAYFSCIDGYTLGHRNALVCQSNKLWDREQPFCAEINNGLSTGQWIGTIVGVSLVVSSICVTVTVILTRRLYRQKNKNESIESTSKGTKNDDQKCDKNEAYMPLDTYQNKATNVNIQDNKVTNVNSKDNQMTYANSQDNKAAYMYISSHNQDNKDTYCNSQEGKEDEDHIYSTVG